MPTPAPARCARRGVALAARNPDRVLVVDRVVAGPNRRSHDRQASQGLVVEPGVPPPAGVPGLQAGQLHRQDRRLQRVQPEVPADVLVGSTWAWSRGPASAGTSRQGRSSLVVIRPPSPKQPRFFEGEETEAADIADPSDLAALVLRADGLGTILDHLEAVPAGDLQDRVHVR